MQRVKPMLEQEQQQRTAIIKNAFMQLPSTEQQQMVVYIESMSEGARTKIGNIIVNIPAEKRVPFLRFVATMTPEHKAQFASELAK